nr:hypothetical protein [Angustibacter aerolatus]
MRAARVRARRPAARPEVGGRPARGACSGPAPAVRCAARGRGAAGGGGRGDLPAAPAGRPGGRGAQRGHARRAARARHRGPAARGARARRRPGRCPRSRRHLAGSC